MENQTESAANTPNKSASEDKSLIVDAENRVVRFLMLMTFVPLLFMQGELNDVHFWPWSLALVILLWYIVFGLSMSGANINVIMNLIFISDFAFWICLVLNYSAELGRVFVLGVLVAAMHFLLIVIDLKAYKASDYERARLTAFMKEHGMSDFQVNK